MKSRRYRNKDGLSAPSSKFLLKTSFSLLAIQLFFFCCGVKEKWNTSTLLYFDTVCEVKIFCLPDRFESCNQEVNRVFTEIEKYFSPESSAYSSPVVLGLFSKSLQFYLDSEGLFDITVGPLSELWKLSGKKNRVPSQEKIKEALNCVGMNKVRKENNRLLLLPNMKLDWGGIAKGLGVDLASNALKKMGVLRGFINAGGDLYCWGKNPSNEPWKIGIKHPREKGFFGILSISELGVATTGDYQRYFEINNIRYHHVFNPYTGYPAQNKQSVTVIGPETVVCDALSTALFISPNPEKILKKYPEYGAITVDSEGNISRMGKTYNFRLI